ncbi:MAG: alpha/beta hydrolase family protein [Lachnospiraceae bacterium]|nr:alpha/beta hydrolase family protein [Lachnospiraceae bacterium]
MDKDNERVLHVDRYYGSLATMRARFDKRSRRDAFAGSTEEDFAAWRRESRRTLTDLLGLNRMETCPLEPLVDDSVTVEGARTEDGRAITREHVILQVEPGIYMTVYLLIPDGPSATGKTRVALALPGHMGAGKESIAGRAEIPAVADSIKMFNYDYGLRLARMGYVVACPDCRGFGERRDEDRQSDSEEDFLNSTCFQLSHMAEGLGETVCGMCTWDAMRLIDYMTDRAGDPECNWDTESITCVGFSGGGMQTLWLAAMDDRVKTALISGYLYGSRDSHLILNGNCSCNYVPRLWEHFDMGDIASLIAPRTLIVQSCRDDHLNGPRGLENVYEQMEIVRAAYRLFDAEERITHDIREGEHCFHPEILQLLGK